MLQHGELLGSAQVKGVRRTAGHLQPRWKASWADGRALPACFLPFNHSTTRLVAFLQNLDKIEFHVNDACRYAVINATINGAKRGPTFQSYGAGEALISESTARLHMPSLQGCLNHR
jgi:hypothetical protein